MYFSAAALLALAASAAAQTAGFDPITKPGQSESIPAGSTYEIDWQTSADYPGTVTITLIGGPSPSLLEEVAVIAKGVDNSLGTYSWAVDSSLGAAATYGLRINLDSNSTVFQYSFPFTISGGSTGSSASASATGSASASASVSSSASASHTKSNATITTSSSSTIVSTTPIGNLSTTAKTTVTSVYTPTGSTSATKTTASTTSVPTSGANVAAAGPIALLGGLVAAMLL